MLSILLLAMMNVGDAPYEVVTLSERSKQVSSAPAGYPKTWVEHIQIVKGTAPEDNDFSEAMRQSAVVLLREFYDDDFPSSFEEYSEAGSVDVSQTLEAISPDLVSVSLVMSYYRAGAPHGQMGGSKHVIWSRRLNRPLRQGDVFAVPPDKALRRLALSNFDNSENLQFVDPDSIPLDWDQASIGPSGISWSFNPYELGGYTSGGRATIPWSALKLYLRRDLPFLIEDIRAVAANYNDAEDAQ